MNFAQDNKISAKFLRKLPILQLRGRDVLFCILCEKANFKKRAVPHKNIAQFFVMQGCPTSDDVRLFEPSGEFRTSRNQVGDPASKNVHVFAENSPLLWNMYFP